MTDPHAQSEAGSEAEAVSTAAAPLVAIDDAVFDYGDDSGFRLRVPSFRLARGETVACIGPSGCGKTTFLHLAAGILVPRRGRVVVDGHDLAAASDAARRRFRATRIGLVFQTFELLEHLTVRENVLLPYYVNPAARLTPQVEDDLRELAQATGVAARLDRRPRALSHGERQRVAICRALVTHPVLLLADEPTGNLDPDTTRRVLELLMREVRRRGTALLMVTHDHSLIGEFDRVVDLGELGELGEQRRLEASAARKDPPP